MPEGEKKASNTSIFSPPVTCGDSPLVRGGQGIVPQFNTSINWDLSFTHFVVDIVNRLWYYVFTM